MLPELPTSLLQAQIQGHVGSRGADEGIAFLPTQQKWLLCVIWEWLNCSCSLKPILFLMDKSIPPALGWLLAPGRLGLHWGFPLRCWDACPISTLWH